MRKLDYGDQIDNPNNPELVPQLTEIEARFNADCEKAEELELAIHFYICAECEAHIQVTEYDPGFPYPEGWEMIEDQTMVELGAQPYWICPKCQEIS